MREIPLLLELWSRACPADAARLLDLASPQLLACHLARTRPSAQVTYANSFAAELEDLQARQLALGLANLSGVLLDARDPQALAPESFDAAVSCSVLEHIQDTPAGQGDSLAIRNVAAALRPGGVLGFSVPFAREGFEETTPRPSYGGEGEPGVPVFFQRFYDEASLHSRLIEPSGLKVEAVTFLGEIRYHPDDIHQRLAPRLAGRWLPLLLGWSFEFLSRHFLRRADDWRQLRKPYVAFVVLRKP